METQLPHFSKLKSDKKHFLPGNIIPHEWYVKFCDENGAPDLVAITVLADVVAWHRNGTSDYYGEDAPKIEGDALSVSYDYFERKFGFGHQRVRRAFVRLEKASVLTREVRNIELGDGLRGNRIFLTLDVKFFDSCFRNPETDIRVRSGDDDCGGNHKRSEQISNKTFFEKNRSTESNSFCLGEDQSRSSFNNKNLREKELKDFYPLSSEDCFELQKSSKRQFDQNVMNEILRDMANRLKGKLFKSKKAFMSYMSKVFAFEMREEPRVNNINFKIIAKGSEEEKAREKEKFLATIENSLEVSPEWHFKKRLAAVLKPDTAYELLKGYKRVVVEEGVFTLELSKHVELSGVEKELILTHAKSTHDGVVTDDGEQFFVGRLAVTMPPKCGFSRNPSEYEPELQSNLWGDIRRGLIENLGKFVDLHWFSKLEAVIDDEAKNLTLKAPNNFVKDWINQNYWQSIEVVSKRLGFRTVFANEVGEGV